MKKQWACSGCGFACGSSRWQSFMKPVICKACRSKKKLSEDEGGKLNLLPNISELIRPSSSIGFSVSKIGMIFGNLTFEPTLAFPLILHGKSQVVTAHDHPHFYSTSTTIHFNQQYAESEERGVVEGEKEAIWDSNKVQKRKRSKLPQYTLSPLARFISHLQRASSHHRRRLSAGPKYDDVLIYQKCLYVAENEIGLGVELLPPPPWVIKEEPSSTNDDSAVDNVNVNGMQQLRRCA